MNGNVFPTSYMGLRGAIQVSVLQRGRVLLRRPPQRNLILNQGLDQFGSTTLLSCLAYMTIGTGSTATEVDSGAVNISTASGLLTAGSTGFLAGDSTDVGKTFKMKNLGSVYQVTAPSSTTQCTVTPTTTAGPDTFILYHTQQTGLEAEIAGQRSASYLAEVGANGSSTVAGVTTHMRTYNGLAQTVACAINEIGFSPSATETTNLFSRIKLSEPLSLDVGQRLQVIYRVEVLVSPVTPLTYATSPIGGWASGTGTLQHSIIPSDYVSSVDGSAAFGVNSADGLRYSSVFEPKSINNISVRLDTDSSAHPTYGSLVSTAGTTEDAVASLSTYVLGSYTRDKQATFVEAYGNRSDWRSYYLYQGVVGSGPRFLFDSAQAKSDSYVLTLGVRTTWGRTL